MFLSSILLLLAVQYSNMADKEFLRYRIHSASSEAQPNAALKLLDTQEEEGWASAPNCSYPQYIVLQFFLPVKTTSISLLFHQYKIPSLVEIFVKERSKQVYERLGYIKPSSNQQTGWEQRELKTIYFEYPCSFIKIVFHQPYSNRYNVLKQVALEEVTVKGALLDPDLGWLSLNTITGGDESQQEEVPARQQIPQSLPPPPSAKTKQQKKPSITIPEIQSIFEILQKKKDEAVEEQNYELASLIKTQITSIKQMQSRLLELEINKKKAIDNQDYDQAALLKNQISKLKQSVQYELGRLTSAAPNRSFSLNSPQPKYYQKESSIQMSANNNTFISEHQSQVVSALANKIYQSNQPQKRFDAECDAKFLNELDSRTQMQIQKYQEIIPLSTWEAILVKDCKFKQKVLIQLESFEFQSLEEIVAALELLTFAIRDKHPTVLCLTLKLLLRISSSEESHQMSSMPQSLTQIMQQIPPLLIDSNVKVRELAVQCLVDIPDIPCVNLHFILSLIVPRKTKGYKEIPKLTQAKLVVAQLLFSRYKFTNEQISQVLEWAVNLLEDSNQDVRSSASEFVLYSLVPILGAEAIKHKVKNIRPNALNTFLMLLNESVGNSKSDIEQSKMYKNDNPKNSSEARNQFYEPFRQKFEPEKGESKLQKDLKTQRSRLQDSQQQIRVFEYGEQQGERREDLCDYCKCQLEGPNYDQSLLEHLPECKMMVACQQCACIIYIRGLCDHLLHQCETAKYHQCDNCTMAFPFSQLHSHKAEGSCKARKKGFERCQMCGRDVQPDDNAWIAHADFCR